MIVKGKVAHALANKLAKLSFIRQQLALLRQEEASLMDEIDALLSTVCDPASVQSIRITEVELNATEQPNTSSDRGDTGVEGQG